MGSTSAARGEHAEQTACRLRDRPTARTHPWGALAMDTLHGCCAGLDVHKKAVVACVRTVRPDGTVDTQTRTFGTVTADLLALADWLEQRGARAVAMESTGVPGGGSGLEGFCLALLNVNEIVYIDWSGASG